jgi:hypothetical protein
MFMKWGRVPVAAGLLLFSLAGVGQAQDFAAEKAIYDQSIMRPDHATFQKWYDEVQSAPEAYIDPQIADRLAAKDMGETAVGPVPNLLDLITYTPSERNQSGCGNCYAWAATGLMEIEQAYKYGTKDRLSLQLFDSCIKDLSGKDACGGGNLAEIASFYTVNYNPIPWSNTNAQFQDQAGVGGAVTCSSITKTPYYGTPAVSVATVTTNSVTQAQAIANIKNVLNQHKGVAFNFWLATGAHWDTFQTFFGSGVETTIWNPDGGGFCGATTDSGFGGHSVIIVGYNDDDANTANHYWIVLNSWGTGWTTTRPNGLFRMKMYMNYGCTIVDGGTTYWSRSFQSLNATYTDTNSLSMAVKGAATPKVFDRKKTAGGWGPWFVDTGSTSHRPALASFNTRQYVAVKGVQSDKIWIRSKNYLGTWGTWSELAGSTTAAPALVVFQNRLYLFRLDATGQYYYKSMGTNGTWSATWTLVATSNSADSPAVVVFDNKLWLYQTGYDNVIYFKGMGTDGVWTGWYNLGTTLKTNVAPTATVYLSNVFLVAKGKTGGAITNDISYIYSTAPTVSYTPWYLLGGATDKSPVISVGPTQNMLNVGLKGNGDTSIWVISWNGSAWSGWNLLNGTSADSPGMNTYWFGGP